MGEGESHPLGDGHLRFSATSAFSRLVTNASMDLTLRPPPAEGSNSAVAIGDRLFLKVYRRLRDGVNPEIEMGRFLTDVSPFPNVAGLAGTLEYQPGSGDRVALAVLQQRVSSQGDGWSYTIDYLQRFAEQALLTAEGEEIAELDTRHAAYLSLMRVLGRRTGELHRALSVSSGDPAFDPEPITDADLSAWRQRLDVEAGDTLEKLAGRFETLPDDAREQAALLLARSLEERRAKTSPLKDVAGMQRSFGYAAAAGVREATVDRPEDLRRLLPLAREWEHAACASFEDGYLEAVAGCPAVPCGSET